jgi:hypothetical protein
MWSMVSGKDTLSYMARRAPFSDITFSSPLDRMRQGTPDTRRGCISAPFLWELDGGSVIWLKEAQASAFDFTMDWFR